MSLTRIKCERITAFDQIDIDFSPGINVFIGANGTGKTHLMKMLYAACDISNSGKSFAEKLVRVFLPLELRIGRLVKRTNKSSTGVIEVFRKESKIKAEFSTHSTINDVKVTGAKQWLSSSVKSVYIPVKEMLSNGPGFRSLYNSREIHFEEVYYDILERAYIPPLKGPVDKNRKTLLDELQKIVEGKVVAEGETFFLTSSQGDLEFTLLAEGIRKLGLLWKLIQNGTLLEGSVLFWDEPETNLNPTMFGYLMNILLKLERMGVQIFIATHNYGILKELDLKVKPEHKIRFHTLYREGKTILGKSVENYSALDPNLIADAFSSLYDREVECSLGGGK